MALKEKNHSSKGSNKRTSKPTEKSSASSSAKRQKKPSSATGGQHKPKPAAAQQSKKKRLPPHARYTEKDLKLAPLNGIRPAGVQKPPNQKKGKQFTDDGPGMRTILALVMAEKEGNIESKMIKARQIEEVREARRVEAETRAEGRKAEFEERKEGIRKGKGKKGAAPREREVEGGGRTGEEGGEKPTKKGRKRVSFG